MSTATNPNVLLPFSFQNIPVRGHVLQLQGLAEHIPTLAQGAENCRQTLTELLAAAALITHDSQMALTTLQIQHPALNLLAFASASSNGTLRAYANPAAQSTPFAAISHTSGGLFAVTLETPTTTTPENTDNRYQSLISLSHPTAAQCLTAYFTTSAQIPTHFAVFSNQHQALALMLQTVGGQTVPPDDWQRLHLLLQTLKTDEALQTSPQKLLQNLFAEDTLLLHQASHPTFAGPSTDTRGRMLAALAALPPAELAELIQQKTVTLTDQTTGQHHTFTAEDLSHLHPQTTNGKPTTH
ncbi:MAG: hypothetical protein EBR79_04065 [Proteobacteria bacterium]|nr:hypothetical protein [Pseudomonadota bacterium]NBX86523.1 hypothetical protein [Pseudomonadota bacterium]